MADKLVALEHIEYRGKKGELLRLAPGDEIPTGFPAEDLAELRTWSSIGTASDYSKRVQVAERDRELAALEAQAAAKGMKLIRAADGGSGSDKKV